MDGAHKQEDKLNIIAIIAVGICGSVLVYVSIVALQAFYSADSAALYESAKYGGQRAFYETVRAQQEAPLASYGRKHGADNTPDTFQIPVAEAMKLVVAEANVDPANLVPSIGRSDTPKIRPIYGRPQLLDAPPAAADAAAPVKPVAKPAVAAPAASAPAAGGNAQPR